MAILIFDAVQVAVMHHTSTQEGDQAVWLDTSQNPSLTSSAKPD